MRTILLCFLFSANLIASAQRECGSRTYLETQLSEISIARSVNSAENFISTRTNPRTSQTTSTKSTQDATSTDVIRIPVVVHIVYNNSSQNIPDEEVRSQLEALNRDFRRRNFDSSNTPERFRSIAADVAIEFFLATADPYGGPTNGIVRRQTTVSEWTTDDKVKFMAQGGSNAWDSRYYLNIWVCNLRRITGYATVPGSPADRDGIVIQYTAFGNGNSGAYNLGRTAVHETGHWLGLKHIWGDSYCGDDGIDDTPQQGNFTPGCPTGFRSSCNNGTNGDMYMNYMDFTYDACINLFTYGQRNKMRACFSEGGPRNSLLSSKGLNAPWTNGREAEEIVLETNTKISIYPNPVSSMLKVKMQDANTITRIRIVTMHGITVMQSNSVSNLHTIDISSLPAGNYLLILDNGKKIQTKEFVKI